MARYSVSKYFDYPEMEQNESLSMLSSSKQMENSEEISLLHGENVELTVRE